MGVSNQGTTGNPFRSIATILSLVVAVGLMGCSSGDGLDRRAVSGSATYAGQPIENGSITLFPLGSGVVASGKIVAGRYDIPAHEGPIPGEYRVEITALKETGRVLKSQEPGMDPVEIPEVISFIPLKYNDQSELTLEVDPNMSATEADFDLAD